MKNRFPSVLVRFAGLTALKLREESGVGFGVDSVPALQLRTQREIERVIHVGQRCRRPGRDRSKTCCRLHGDCKACRS